MTKEVFYQLLEKYFTNVTKEKLILIEQYKLLVQKYNKKFNLTRLADDELFYEQFVLDSIIPYKDLDILQKPNISLLDVGTGSGIPGILLKIIFPNLSVTLLEANLKKCEFLALVIKSLNLNNINILNIRAENITDNLRESFDVATSRAVASLYKILEISAPFVKVGGYLIQPKSIKINEELQEAKGTIELLKLELIDNYHYKITNHEHNVVVFLKTEISPYNLPRP